MNQHFETRHNPYPTTPPYRPAPAGRRRTPIPDRIGRICVPLGVLESTSHIMRAFGDQQRECYVWWGGYFTPSGDAQVLTAYCPDVPTDYGRIHLRREHFQSMHGALRERDQVLITELHTHPPGAGGQNEVDAAHAAAPYPGFITIVVPNFAEPHLHDLRCCHVYEYLQQNDWLEFDAAAIGAKFVIEEPFVLVQSQ